MTLKSFAIGILSASPLQNWPVRVRGGLAKGARWTALPFSYNWRLGGETDVARCAAMAGNLTGKCCWDLGAHFGIHTVGLAMAVGPTGQVVGMEPDPVAFEKLTRHCRMNGLSQAKLFKAAASGEDGEIELIVSGKLGSTTTHVRYHDESNESGQQSFKMNCVRMDSLVDEGKIRSPAMIKMDVEGHGASAVAGALSAIRAARPLIAFSIHGEAEWSGVAGLLMPLGYRPYLIDSREQISWDVFPAGVNTVALMV